MLRKAKTQRSKEQQMEKELPWSAVPAEMRPAFRAAEAKQWGEHLTHAAIEVL